MLISSPATIRRARASDAAAIASLIQQYVSSGALLPRAPEFIAERTIDFLVATIDGRVVGCANLEEYSPSLGELRSLAVEPSFQRRGVGVALVKAVEKLASTREYATLFAVSNNETFFRSRGYTPSDIPELDRERSDVSRFKGVYAKALAERQIRPAQRHDAAPRTTD